MLTESEQPPLTQQLDNIAEIEKSLNHDWQPFESAPDGVLLLWYFTDVKQCDIFKKSTVESDKDIAVWQPLPPPPEKKDV